MPRHTHEKILRVRFRKPDRSIRSILVSGGAPKSTRVSLGDRKVLRVGKVSKQEVEKTGEYFPADQILKDLKKVPREGSVHDENPRASVVPQHGF